MTSEARSLFPPVGRRPVSTAAGRAPCRRRWLGSLILALAILPWTAGALETQRFSSASDATRPLASVFEGDDGGAYYVTEIDDHVYWLAEGRGYAHVFHGIRRGDHINGEYWSVPSADATARGTVRLRILGSGSMGIDDDAGAFPSHRLSVSTRRSLDSGLQPMAKPQRTGRDASDLDGAFDGPNGLRIFAHQGRDFRDRSRRVVFFGQDGFSGTRAPDVAFVFIGSRSGDLVTGELIPVPKGKLRAPRKAADRATITLRVNPDRSLTIVEDYKVLGVGILGRTRWTPVPMSVPHDATGQPVFGDGRSAPIGQTVEREIWLRGHKAPLRVATDRVGEYEVIEGDILVGGGGQFRASAIADQGKLWPGGIVPFEIDPSVSATTKASIRAAIAHINARTHAQIVQRSGERDYVSFVERDLNGAGGSSPVGRVGSGRSGEGRQVLLLMPGASQGIVIHELCHTLGLFHEQSRFDRDQYVEIVLANVQRGREYDFQKHVSDGMDLGPYDYASIMHYSDKAFSIDGVRKTILPKRDGVAIGQSRALSDLDVKAINHLYPPTQTVPGLGARGDGADVAVTNLDANPRPEIVLMAYDDAPGQNTFKYIVGYNVNADGFTSVWSSTPIVVDGLGESADGAGMAIADLDGNGRPDLVLMAYDRGNPENTFKWKVGPDLDAHGWPTKPWRQRAWVRGLGTRGHGADIEIADVTRDGKLDIILMAYDAPEGKNAIKYLVGSGVDANGTVSPTAWIGPIKVEGLGDRGEGAGVLLANVNDNRRKDLVFMVYDAAEGQNSFKFRIELDPTENAVGTASERWHYQGLGHHAEGAGLAAADLDGNGLPDLIVMAYDDPGDDAHTNNSFKYRVLRDALKP